jgi:iron complex outermembrane recepter protein
MKKTAFSRKLLMTAVSSAVLMSYQAYANESTALEEVLVTAQKREQSVLEIPFAISAIGEAEIKDRGALDIKDLQYSIPGLSITNNTPGQDRVQIRGASADAGIGLPTVGRYVDEVSVSSDTIQRALDVPLLDIGRVEVLRGPQGTLYGAGSIGGTMRFITNSPDLSEVGGSVGFGVNSIDGGGEGYELNGVINIPLIEDKLAIRIAASTEDIAGWIDNTATGESEINEAERDFIRTKVLYQPSDSFDASLMWMHYEFEQDSSSREISKAGGGMGLLNPDDREATRDRIVDVPFETPTEDEWDLFNLVLNFHLENADIVSSTGYQERTIDFTSESPNAFFPPDAFGSIVVEDREAEIFTQEIRVNSNWDKPFNYTIGAFYRDSETSQTQIQAPPAIFGAPPTVTTGTAPVDSESWAIFGELSYDFSDALTASFGLRYFEEDQEPLLLLLQPGLPPLDVSPEKQSFDAVSPRINLLWRVSDSASMYASVSEGFRSGGINGFGSAIPDFEPEEVIVYEVGGRGELFDGRLYLDAAAYYSDYEDIQVSVIDLAAGRIRTTNADSASGPGVDLALGFNITDSLSLDLTAGYIGLEYDDVDTGGAFVPSVQEGDSMQYTPEYTASASLSYDFNWTADLGGMTRLDLSHADGFSFYNRGFEQQPVVETDSLTYLNFRIGMISEAWQVMLSGTNLLDEKDEVFPGTAFSYPTYSRPRTVSVKVDYNF